MGAKGGWVVSRPRAARGQAHELQRERKGIQRGAALCRARAPHSLRSCCDSSRGTREVSCLFHLSLRFGNDLSRERSRAYSSVTFGAFHRENTILERFVTLVSTHTHTRLTTHSVSQDSPCETSPRRVSDLRDASRRAAPSLSRSSVALHFASSPRVRSTSSGSEASSSFGVSFGS